MNSKMAGSLIRAKREELGIELSAMASEIAVKATLLGAYEDGSMRMSEDHGTRIAARLGLDPDAIGIERPIAGKTIPNHFWNLLMPPRLPREPGRFKAWLRMLRSAFRRQAPEGSFENQLFHPERIPDGSSAIFLRIGLVLVAVFLAATVAANIVLIDVSLSLVVPLTLLWYLYERHEPRTISGATILALFLFGGLVAIFAVYYERSFVGYPGIPLLGDLITAVVEESAKIFIVILVGIRLKAEHPVTGILIGFAVGAGFSAFETMDYGLYFLIDTLDLSVMRSVVFERSVNALFGIGHHYWTGMVAGAVAAVSRTGTLRFDHLFRRVPLAFFLFAVFLHASWNALAALESPTATLLMLALRIVSLALFILVWVTAVRGYRGFASARRNAAAAQAASAESEADRPEPEPSSDSRETPDPSAS